MIKECKKHGLTEHSTRPDNGGSRCRKCMVEHVTKKRRNLKLKGIEYLGGSCIKCGYNRCADALDFHHRIPTEKEFSISTGNTIGWNKIKIELNKCDLLCSNCHRELHSVCLGS